MLTTILTILMLIGARTVVVQIWRDVRSIRSARRFALLKRRIDRARSGTRHTSGDACTPAQSRSALQREAQTLTPWLRQRGWSEREGLLEGELRHPDGTTSAEMELFDDGYEIRLFDPPDWVLEEHPHRACIHLYDEGWYLIHQEGAHSDAASAVSAAEGFLRECFAYSRREVA